MIDNVKNGNVILKYVPTEEMAADVLTKNLPPQKFADMTKLMDMK